MLDAAAEFFDTDDFAVEARVNAGRSIKVIFESPQTLALDVDTQAYTCTCMVADHVSAGDLLTMKNGKRFKALARITGDDAIETWQLAETP